MYSLDRHGIGLNRNDVSTAIAVQDEVRTFEDKVASSK